jgi:hypothetical protein
MLQAGRLQVEVPMRSINLFNLPNSSSRTTALGLAQSLTEINTRQCIWGIERSWCFRLTISMPFVSPLSRQCGILKVLQPYRPPRPVMEIAFSFCYKVGLRDRVAINF